MKGPKPRVIDLRHRAALLADEMSVGRRSDVVRRWSVAEVDVLDNAESLQLVQVAVDRREMNIGRFRLDGGGDLFGSVVLRF